MAARRRRGRVDRGAAQAPPETQVARTARPANPRQPGEPGPRGDRTYGRVARGYQDDPVAGDDEVGEGPRRRAATADGEHGLGGDGPVRPPRLARPSVDRPPRPWTAPARRARRRRAGGTGDDDQAAAELGRRSDPPLQTGPLR